MSKPLRINSCIDLAEIHTRFAHRCLSTRMFTKLSGDAIYEYYRMRVDMRFHHSGAGTILGKLQKEKYERKNKN